MAVRQRRAGTAQHRGLRARGSPRRGSYGVVLGTMRMQSMMGQTLRHRVQPVQLSVTVGRWVSASNWIACGWEGHVIDAPCGKGQNRSHFSACISCSAALGDILARSGAAAIATVGLAGKKPPDSLQLGTPSQPPERAVMDDSCSSGSQGRYPVQRQCQHSPLPGSTDTQP